jgi:hypothetical protein
MPKEVLRTICEYFGDPHLPPNTPERKHAYHKRKRCTRKNGPKRLYGVHATHYDALDV